MYHMSIFIDLDENVKKDKDMFHSGIIDATTSHSYKSTLGIVTYDLENDTGACTNLYCCKH